MDDASDTGNPYEPPPPRDLGNTAASLGHGRGMLSLFRGFMADGAIQSMWVGLLWPAHAVSLMIVFSVFAVAVGRHAFGTNEQHLAFAGILLSIAAFAKFGVAVYLAN